jgi:hypothetical protein
MSFQTLVTAAQTYFPTLKIGYKDQSTFMKILGTLLFFNKDFMTNYITTIGDTVYFSSASWVALHPVTAEIVLMHECVHMSDEKKWTSILFGFSYLLPQILIFICPILFFFIHWYIALPIMLFFALPLPAYFRMIWEKRAYIAGLYAQYKLSKILNFNPNLPAQVIDDLGQFTSGAYYWVWPFSNINADFNNAVTAINAGQRPYDDNNVFNMIDDLVTKV